MLKTFIYIDDTNDLKISNLFVMGTKYIFIVRGQIKIRLLWNTGGV